eukprot:TRINITY_DN12762_c0_g1_i1.p1 TRINITY_DN12762_c0_g1~~TRINITY_DN12762_c0_g1_i1.p1  ORF type:complete len:501 (+),score=128.46 TRINITY_DN12762_c0_g1_i1:59-1504(+)
MEGQRKAGSLQKPAGYFSRLRSRWFVLTGEKLHYWEKEEDAAKFMPPRGTWSLDECEASSASGTVLKLNFRYNQDISHNKKSNTIELHASSPQEAFEWAEAVKAAVAEEKMVLRRKDEEIERQRSEMAKKESEHLEEIARREQEMRRKEEELREQVERALRDEMREQMERSVHSQKLALKAAADLKAQLDRGQEQLDEQIAAHGGSGLHLDKERTCSICYESYENYNDGVECGGKEAHFLCNECFVNSVKALITEEPGKQDLMGGRLCCPFKTFPPTEGSCDAQCFEDRIVARKVEADTFEEYQQVRTKLLEGKLAKEAELEMEKKIEAAIKDMEEKGVKVFQTQKFIVDDILTMHCPRCKMAFADWDGCNALYCTYAGCGCNFCAFCLEDCGGGVKFGQKEIVRDGGDAVHRHVNQCKYAQGIGHGNDGRVQSQVWNKVRKQRIEDCLREKCDTVEQRQQVVTNLKRQFDDLGLQIVVPG